MAERVRPETIWVTSGYGGNTRQPFVSVKLRDVAVMIRPAEARDLASNLLACAEAAETDALVIHWATERLGLPDGDQVYLLRDFRRYRDELHEQRNERSET